MYFIKDLNNNKTKGFIPICFFSSSEMSALVELQLMITISKTKPEICKIK